MEIVRYILVFLEVTCSILLLGIILIQRTKGQGLGGLGFGQAMGENLFGAQTGNIMTKITVVLAGIFLVNTTFLALLYAKKKTVSVIEDFKPLPVTAPATPGFPGASGLGGTLLTPSPAASPTPDVPAADVAPRPSEGS